MNASYQTGRTESGSDQFYDVMLGQQQFHLLPSEQSTAVLRVNRLPVDFIGRDFALRFVQDRADIDISGPEFNFVRTIRVFDIRSAYQRESGRDDDCNRSTNIYLGTYSTQGEFSWTPSSLEALPEAHIGLERWGYGCPTIYHRAVFVEWRDSEGNYGFEQVNY